MLASGTGSRGTASHSPKRQNQPEDPWLHSRRVDSDDPSVTLRAGCGIGIGRGAMTRSQRSSTSQCRSAPQQ
jgi:hypothetical protein